MKRLTQTLAFCLLTVSTAVAQKNYVSEVWVSDLGNGKYKDRKSTRLNSSHSGESRMPSSA